VGCVSNFLQIAVLAALAATVLHEAMLALGLMLTVASLLAAGLYTLRAKTE